MNEIDIWRSANQLLNSYGEEAARVAASKVVEMQRANDGEGMAVWVQIMLAIRELTKEPSGSESGN